MRPAWDIHTVEREEEGGQGEGQEGKGGKREEEGRAEKEERAQKRQWCDD